MFGIPNDVAMQVVAVGFIIGVLQDSCETALNSSPTPCLPPPPAWRKTTSWRKTPCAVNPPLLR
jgi:hypothetical protein